MLELYTILVLTLLSCSEHFIEPAPGFILHVPPTFLKRYASIDFIGYFTTTLPIAEAVRTRLWSKIGMVNSSARLMPVAQARGRTRCHHIISLSEQARLPCRSSLAVLFLIFPARRAQADPCQSALTALTIFINLPSSPRFFFVCACCEY